MLVGGTESCRDHPPGEGSGVWGGAWGVKLGRTLGWRIWFIHRTLSGRPGLDVGIPGEMAHPWPPGAQGLGGGHW